MRLAPALVFVVVAGFVALAAQGPPPAQRLPPPGTLAGTSGSHIVSPVAMASWEASVDSAGARSLRVAVLWRGSPGWFLKQPAIPPEGDSSGGNSRIFRSTFHKGGFRFDLAFDYVTRIATVDDTEVPLGNNNVILVDDVDRPKGQRRIVKTLRVDPAFPQNEERIQSVLRRSPEVLDFLRCDVPVPAVQGVMSVICAQLQSGVAMTPQAIVDELLAADRAFAAASAKTDVIAGLSAMVAPDVVAPIPGNQFADGAAKFVEYLKSNPDNARSTITWAPIRGGISADGLHGFTYGYMSMKAADGTETPLKYLSYWVKGANGWRVAAYKRGRRPAGEVSMAMLPPSLPAGMMVPYGDAAMFERYRASLAAAEKSFSNRAQMIGLGPAFEEYGSEDAMNLGGPNSPGFTMGNKAIGAAIGAGAKPGDPSPVNWAADHKVIVAFSGDLGVTFGWIKPAAAADAASARQATPFFTIWRRANPSAPWRYIAE